MSQLAKCEKRRQVVAVQLNQKVTAELFKEHDASTPVRSVVHGLAINAGCLGTS